MEYPYVPSNVEDLIHNKFKAAKDSGNLNYYSTEVTVLEINGVPFQLRFSPALANKPTSKDSSKKDTAPFDPFENPPRELFICDLPPSHFLVLNKFAIIPEHFILATKHFKEQTDLLEDTDFAAIYALLKAWTEAGKELFVFFNSGPHSGASQRHRHVQFLPVEGMRKDLHEGPPWNLLLDGLREDSYTHLPFKYFVATIPENPTSEQLSAIYRGLYEKACYAVLSWSSHNPENAIQMDGGGEGTAMISYNLGITRNVMVLCPRRAEGLEISRGNDNPEKGFVALNGTLLAGTLLVKNEMEWNTLRNDENKLAKVLEAIGIPSSIIETEKL